MTPQEAVNRFGVPPIEGEMVMSNDWDYWVSSVAIEMCDGHGHGPPPCHRCVRDARHLARSLPDLVAESGAAPPPADPRIGHKSDPFGDR